MLFNPDKQVHHLNIVIFSYCVHKYHSYIIFTDGITLHEPSCVRMSLFNISILSSGVYHSPVFYNE